MYLHILSLCFEGYILLLLQIAFLHAKGKYSVSRQPFSPLDFSFSFNVTVSINRECLELEGFVRLNSMFETEMVSRLFIIFQFLRITE